MGADTKAGYVDAVYLQQLAELIKPVKEKIISYIRPQKGDRILDVGCGPGLDAMALTPLVQPGGEVVGVDHDPDMISRAETLARHHNLAGLLAYHHADAYALPFPDSSFDAVRSERMLQHLEQPAKAFAEMVRVVKPGGRVVVADTDHSTLSIDMPDFNLDLAFRTYLVRRLANGTSGRSLRAMAKTAGLRDPDVWVYAGCTTDFNVADSMALLSTVLDEGAAKGAIAAGDAEAIRTSWKTAHQNGTFFATENIIVVCGTRPG